MPRHPLIRLASAASVPSARLRRQPLRAGDEALEFVEPILDQNQFYRCGVGRCAPLEQEESLAVRRDGDNGHLIKPVDELRPHVEQRFSTHTKRRLGLDWDDSDPPVERACRRLAPARRQTTALLLRRQPTPRVARPVRETAEHRLLSDPFHSMKTTWYATHSERPVERAVD